VPTGRLRCAGVPGRLFQVGLCAILVAACHDAPDPSEPAPITESPHVLHGPIVCDSCATVEFSIAGPDLTGVLGATFVSPGTPPDTLSATIELRRFTGDSGVTLTSKAAFTGPVAPGVYDLWLATPGRNLPSERLVIPSALRVVRGWSPGGPPAPPVDTSHSPGGDPPPTKPPPPPSHGVGKVRVVVSSTGVIRTSPSR